MTSYPPFQFSSLAVRLAYFDKLTEVLLQKHSEPAPPQTHHNFLFNISPHQKKSNTRNNTERQN